jgi:O-antigen/teichoic acid export membrane protein
MNRTKNISIIGFSDIVGSAISAIFWFYLATLLTPEGYGKIFYFLGVAGLISYVSSIGTQNLVTVYSAKKVQINSELYSLTIPATTIAAIVTVFFIQRFDVGLLIFGYVVFNLAVGQVLGERDYKKYTYINLLQKSLTPVLGLGFFFLFGVESIIYGLALSYVFHASIILKKIKIRNFNFLELKERWKFIFSNYINNLSNGFNSQIDKLIIVPIFGFSVLGNYSLAIQFMLILLIIPNTIYKYLLAEASSGIFNRKLEKQICIIAVFLTIVVILLSPLIIPSFFPKYIDSVEFIRIMSLSILPITISKIYLVSLLSQEKGTTALFGTLISIIIFIIGILSLGVFFGNTGIAITYVISTVSQTIFFYVTNKLAKKTV